MKVLVDHHHTDLTKALQLLIEKRGGGSLYRPSGHDWYHKGYYYHPLIEEALGNLTPARENDVELMFNERMRPERLDKEQMPDLSEEDYFHPDARVFRWLPLERAKELDLIICSSDRNQRAFFNLRRDLGLKCKIVRYIGNRHEDVDDSTFDILLPATLRYYDLYVKTGAKPGLLYHPEFSLDLYKYTKPEQDVPPIVRTFLNFIWHDGSGSDRDLWLQYKGFADQAGIKFITHGLGTPPPGVPAERNMILDTWFRKNPEYAHLVDRTLWPNLEENDGEPISDVQISRLMSKTSLAWHVKRCDGYGFIVHKLAASGRPIICEERNYHDLSARAFLQNGETCLHVTGNVEQDRRNFQELCRDPDRLLTMSRLIYSRFKDTVDFDKEAETFFNLL